jgi:hypothetical protein
MLAIHTARKIGMESGETGAGDEGEEASALMTGLMHRPCAPGEGKLPSYVREDH